MQGNCYFKTNPASRRPGPGEMVIIFIYEGPSKGLWLSRFYSIDQAADLKISPPQGHETRKCLARLEDPRIDDGFEDGTEGLMNDTEPQDKYAVFGAGIIEGLLEQEAVAQGPAFPLALGPGAGRRSGWLPIEAVLREEARSVVQELLHDFLRGCYVPGENRCVISVLPQHAEA